MFHNNQFELFFFKFKQCFFLFSTHETSLYFKLHASADIQIGDEGSTSQSSAHAFSPGANFSAVGPKEPKGERVGAEARS
jgi:hypothetical protein